MTCLRRTFIGLLMVALIAGCASGPTYTEMKSKIAPLRPDGGRVFVYRDSSFGAAVRPNVLINGKVVGVSMANGFFYVDLPPGDYKLSAETEVERSLSFTLAPGETKYIQSYISFGLLVGRINFDLVSPAAGEAALQGLSYNVE